MDRRVATFSVIVGLLLLAYAFIPGYGPQYTAFAHTHVLLMDTTPGVPVTAVRYIDEEGQQNALTYEQRKDDAVIWVNLSKIQAPKNSRLFYRVEVTREGGKVEPESLQVLSRELGLTAALGALLAVVAGPLVLIRSSRLQTRDTKKLITGWTYLLVEPQTGLSLARLQLILLFVPTAVVYIALAVPLHEFPPVPDSVWQLLGIGGATAALSTLITPGKVGSGSGSDGGPQTPGGEPAQQAPGTPASEAMSQAAAAAMPTEIKVGATTYTIAYTPPAQAEPAAAKIVEIDAPALTDLFAEPNGYGDISRYQSLVMCITTAAIFFVSFFDTWTVPDIPDQMLQLLGTSLAVYLGVKGIKMVKKDEPGK